MNSTNISLSSMDAALNDTITPRPVQVLQMTTELDDDDDDDDKTEADEDYVPRGGKRKALEVNPVKKATVQRTKGKNYVSEAKKVAESFLSKVNVIKVSNPNALASVIETEARNTIIKLGDNELNHILVELSKMEKEDIKNDNKAYLNNLISMGEDHIKEIVRDYKNSNSTQLRSKLGETQKSIHKLEINLKKLKEVEQLVNGYLEVQIGSGQSITLLRSQIRKLQNERELAASQSSGFF